MSKTKDKVEYIVTNSNDKDGYFFEYLTESDLQKKLFTNSLNGWRIFKVNKEYFVTSILKELGGTNGN